MMQGRARLLLSLCCGCCLLLLLLAHLRLDSAARSYSYMNVVQQVGYLSMDKLYAIKIIKLF